MFDWGVGLIVRFDSEGTVMVIVKDAFFVFLHVYQYSKDNTKSLTGQ